MRKILIINANSIYVNNATGITIRSILNTYDCNNIMEIFWNDIDLPDVCVKSIKLSPQKFSLLKMRKHNILNDINYKIKQNNIQTNNKRNTVSKKIRQFISLISDSTGIHITKKILDEINIFKPDVIYTLGGGVNSLKMAYKISKRLNIPIVIHYMDNWIHCIQWEDNKLLYFYKKKLRKYAKLCRTRSSTGITISPGMAEEYTKEFGIEHFSIMNSIDVKSFECNERNKDDTFRFIYAGGIHLGREESLISMADIIERISDYTEKKLYFDIYTSDDDANMYKKKFERYKCVNFKKYIPHDKIMEVYQKADALVHVENNVGNNEFFKYSISTKISEYLSTGKPFIFFGPQNIYLYEFLKNNNIALVASTTEALERQINKIITDYDSTKIIAKNAKKYALDNFDISVSQERFKSAIEKAKL